jgi:hypothetical protein
VAHIEVGFGVDFGSIWARLLTTAGVVSLEVCLVGPQATSNRTSEDENTVGIGCRHRRSSCDWTRDFILRRILPLTYPIPHLTCDPRRLILYYTAYPAHPILHGSIRLISNCRTTSLGNRGSLRSHSGNLRNCMKLKEEVKGERGARFARMGDICGTV